MWTLHWYVRIINDTKTTRRSPPGSPSRDVQSFVTGIRSGAVVIVVAANSEEAGPKCSIHGSVRTKVAAESIWLAGRLLKFNKHLRLQFPVEDQSLNAQAEGALD